MPETRPEVRLHVRDWPSTRADVPRKTALLLHGVTGGADAWWRLGPHLAAKGYHVYAPDLRGHGQSERGPSYHSQCYADDLAQIDGWPYDIVIGHSLGTWIACVAASQQGAAFAKRLVLIEPVLAFSGPEEQEHVMQQQLDEMHETPEMLRAAHSRWPDGDIQTKAALAPACSRDMVVKTFTENNPMEFRKEALAVRVPVLAMGADLSLGSTYPAKHEEEMKQNKNWTTQRFPKAGHSIHRDDWPSFVAALDTVL